MMPLVPLKLSMERLVYYLKSRVLVAIFLILEPTFSVRNSMPQNSGLTNHSVHSWRQGFPTNSRAIRDSGS